MADVTKVQVGNEYEIKDSFARANKLDKYKDDTASGVINFLNGIKIDNCNIYYNASVDTVFFE